MPIFRVVAMAIAKTFSKLFGLATITFFGRAPSRDDDKVGFVGLLSVSWLVCVFAVIVPEAAEVIIPFLPDDEVVLRGVAIGLTVLIPLVVGTTVSQVANRHGAGKSRARTIVAGYLYAPAIGLLVAALIVVVPIVKAKSLVQRLEMRHLAVMIPEGDYDGVRDHVLDILERNGMEAHRADHPRVIRLLFSGLALMEARIFCRSLDRHMERIIVPIDDQGAEITVHATDISIIGSEWAASRLFALLADEIDVRVAFFSWDDESQEIERELRRCRDRLDEGSPCPREQLGELADRLANLSLSAPEWNAIRRQIYRLAADSERLRVEQGEPSPAAER